MSPTPRRVKKQEPSSDHTRNRVLAAIGIIVVLSMFLSLVVVPGNGFGSGQTQPTSTPDALLQQQQLMATISAMMTQTALAQPAATKAPITATGTLTATPPATPTP